MKRSATAQFVILLVITCLPDIISANAATKFAAVGDSITQGIPYFTVNGNGCTNCGQYTWRLETLLDAESKWFPSTVYNYGVSGETSDKGANRIPGIISSVNPKYVLFMEGTNDRPKVSPETVVARITTAVNNILAGGKIPIVGTLLPDTRYANSYKNIYEINQMIRDMLAQKGVQLAELYCAATPGSGSDCALEDAERDWKNSYLSDRIHPNYAGYQLMAEIWYAALSPSTSFLPAVYLLLLE